MEENRRVFGRMPDGAAVEELTLRALGPEDDKYVCKIITYGGAVRSLTMPDRNGDPVDVVLGFDTLEDYRTQDKYIGALVGRYANRIGGARFTLNGAQYSLAANDGENSLHGGLAGFDKQVWTVEKLEGNSVTLSLVSPDMQEGYPGTLEVRVTYTLSDGGLAIDYRAKCDKDTVCNFTNHCYFNLSGHDSGPVTGQYIRLKAAKYTPTRPGSIPTGEIAPVEGTPMDLRKAQRIGEHIDDPFEQLAMAKGYDHNWVVDGYGKGSVRTAAAAWSPETGIGMNVLTSLPGVQFYAGNFVGGCPAGKGGAVYKDRHGFCLETQLFPDSPNRPEFPSCVLKAGEEYHSATIYSFLTVDSAEKLDLL